MINILFIEMSHCEDPKIYIRQKLRAGFEELPDLDLDQLVAKAHGESTPLSLPLTQSKDFPRLSERQQRSVARKTKMFVAAVDRLSPLLDAETKLEEDFCTYLNDYFREYARGTPVLVRKTNFATICYVFQNVSVDSMTAEVSYKSTNLLAVAGPQDVDKHIDSWMQANMLRAAGPLKPEEILVKVAKGLAGLLPSPYNTIGATLLNLIMPSGGGINYDELLNHIATIIADANRRQSISEQAGILSGVVSYMNGNYIPQRDAQRSTKADLFDLLNSQLVDVYKVAGVLKQPEFRKGGLSTFISAVNHKYLLYQEMAAQDPTVTDMQSSSKAASIRHDAGEDATHVLTVVDELQTQFDNELNAWISEISQIHIRITDCPKNEYYFHDSHTNYRSPYFEQCGCKDDPYARAVHARNDYIGCVRRQFNREHQDQLPWMREVANYWKQLVENPLAAGRESTATRRIAAGVSEVGI